MSFNGSLLSFSTDNGQTWTNFPLDYVFKESYTVAPNRRQDLDSTRNANGVLKRNVLKHTASTITLQTRPMTNKDMARMMSKITSNYVKTKERKLYVKYYCPDTDSYSTGSFYVADIEYPIMRIDGNVIYYNSTTLDLVEY